MKGNTWRLLPLAAACIAMTGCSAIRKVTAPDDENLLSGAGSILVARNGKDSATTEAFEVVELEDLLKQYGLQNPDTIATGHSAQADRYKYLRNDLQERLITASNQRCASYMRTLITSKSQTQTGWTGLATLLSGAAAVVGHAPTAQALAAGSAVSTGLLSTYNEAYFNNLTVTVIAGGIAARRESILANIGPYKAKPLSDYSVNAAIADALSYHGACNIVSGMEAAAKATSLVDIKTLAPLNR